MATTEILDATLEPGISNVRPLAMLKALDLRKSTSPLVPFGPLDTPEGENMAVSVLFRIDQRGHIEVADGGPAPAVVVDTDGQLHAESGIITLAGEDLDGYDLWRWLSG